MASGGRGSPPATRRASWKTSEGGRVDLRPCHPGSSRTPGPSAPGRAARPGSGGARRSGAASRATDNGRGRPWSLAGRPRPGRSTTSRRSSGRWTSWHVAVEAGHPLAGVLKVDVVGRLTVRADAAAGQAIHEHGRRHVEEQGGRHVPALKSKLRVERPRLRPGAGKAVEQGAACRVGVLEPLHEHVDDEVIGHKLATVHVLLRRRAEVGAASAMVAAAGRRSPRAGCRACHRGIVPACPCPRPVPQSAASQRIDTTPLLPPPRSSWTSPAPDLPQAYAARCPAGRGECPVIGGQLVAIGKRRGGQSLPPRGGPNPDFLHVGLPGEASGCRTFCATCSAKGRPVGPPVSQTWHDSRLSEPSWYRQDDERGVAGRCSHEGDRA